MRYDLLSQEMSENLEVFREVWSMHLSATRNRIIRINLGVTVASFALTACIVPASFFGMNLPSGLGQLERLFMQFLILLPHMKQHEIYKLGKFFMALAFSINGAIFTQTFTIASYSQMRQ